MGIYCIVAFGKSLEYFPSALTRFTARHILDLYLYSTLQAHRFFMLRVCTLWHAAGNIRMIVGGLLKSWCLDNKIKWILQLKSRVH